MHERDGPTDVQKEEEQVLIAVTEKTKDIIMAKRKELGDSKLERTELRKLKIMHYKKDENEEPIPDSSYTIYPKLMIQKEGMKKNKKTGEEEPVEFAVLTKLIKYREPIRDEAGEIIQETDENGEPIADEEYDYKELVGKHCIVHSAAMRYKGVHYGAAIKSMQLELREAIIEVKEQTGGNRRVLYNKSVRNPKMEMGKSARKLLQDKVKEEAEVKDPDAEEEEPVVEEVKKPAKKTPAKKSGSADKKKPAKKVVEVNEEANEEKEIENREDVEVEPSEEPEADLTVEEVESLEIEE